MDSGEFSCARAPTLVGFIWQKLLRFCYYLVNFFLPIKIVKNFGAYSLFNTVWDELAAHGVFSVGVLVLAAPSEPGIGASGMWPPRSMLCFQQSACLQAFVRDRLLSSIIIVIFRRLLSSLT